MHTVLLLQRPLGSKQVVWRVSSVSITCAAPRRVSNMHYIVSKHGGEILSGSELTLQPCISSIHLNMILMVDILLHSVGDFGRIPQ